MKIEKSLFGYLDERAVDAYRIENSGGAFVRILSMGGIVQQLWMPDRTGKLRDIVCGFDTVEGYLTGEGYFGALIGRYGNRIGGASFTLDGETYRLFVNSGKKDSLHGGREGFSRKIWDVTPIVGDDDASLVLRYLSPDMEEGYPGNLRVRVTYRFTEDNRFEIHYEAETDRATVINLTNHTYFNLQGYDGGDIFSHLFWLDADAYNDVDDDLIPLPGEAGWKKVDGTVFDFRRETPIAHPFDHSFRFTPGNGMVQKRGTVYEPVSGRMMTLYTSNPEVQFYTGCVMDVPVPFKGGVPQQKYHAFCLETQYAPDSPNRPLAPSCVLRPGERYDFTTVFAFGVR